MRYQLCHLASRVSPRPFDLYSIGERPFHSISISHLGIQARLGKKRKTREGKGETATPFERYKAFLVEYESFLTYGL